MRDIRPEISPTGIPYCSEECPSHDGKRCRVLGHRPGNICEPSVQQLVDALKPMGEFYLARYGGVRPTDPTMAKLFDANQKIKKLKVLP